MSCLNDSLNIIRGDTFSYPCHFDGENDEPIDLTDTQFDAVIETLSQSWQQPLVVTKADQIAHKGDFFISAETTDDWLIGDLQIRLTRIIGTVRLSALIPVFVERG
ncbi:MULTISPECIES: hypothetical protein [unclassified Acinetobacter]|uniref:hypothetical protein n=1 Tax=unclassified Acinetobacter TaxID=196816 RepID=UPI00244D3653|nr:MULTISPECIES: hypothetical protein [unclassified Acinetobacter]MDH0030302.1 hypothetical protein [Acinetobacter sp. GD04021]MDH0885870.1 hypothetical protein [Acinetobacter sp. GD03873]MDH1082490.1 hypothetical protein [Acinetobacter sp. GD03983]MDH2189118.1 hypothetical protein [Acinetobacter sp. GD03645]MDH2202306.1 hypothetical protein [Acinetobacter sp. GD03647]